jgi:hypothetical protein
MNVDLTAIWGFLGVRANRRRPSGPLARVVITACIASVSSLAGQHWTDRVHPDLVALSSDATPHVIVQYKEVPAERHHSRAAHLGARIHRDLHVIRASSLEVPASALEALGL